MKTSKKNTNFILGAIILVAFIIGTYCFFKFLFSAFNGFSDNFKNSIVSAFAVIIAATIGFFTNKSIEYKRSIEQSMRPKKLELYENYIKFLTKLLMNEKVVKKPNNDEMVQFFAKTTPLSIIYASNQVLKNLAKIRKITEKPEDGIFIMEDLLIEIRKDLGHTKRDLKKGDILRLFINDIDEYISIDGKIIKKPSNH